MKKFYLILLIFTNNVFPFQHVDLNSASKEQISLLSGIGPSLAQKIIDEKDKNGFYKSFAELLKRHEKYTKKLLQVESLVTFNIKKNQSTKKIDATLKPVLPSFSLIPLHTLLKIAHKLNRYENDYYENLSKKARLRGWVPKLALETDNNFLSGQNEKLVENNDDTFYKKKNKNFGFRIKIDFDLKDLLFSKYEISIESLRQKNSLSNEKSKNKIENTYFALKKILAREGLSEGAKELITKLDILTNNAVSEYDASQI